jgi:hypothetical protein
VQQKIGGKLPRAALKNKCKRHKSGKKGKGQIMLETAAGINAYALK